MKVDKKITKKNSNWNFKGNVYKYFDKHIKKSIPFYTEAQNLYTQYTDFFLQDRSKIIDLGSSTGVFLNKVYDRWYCWTPQSSIEHIIKKHIDNK